MMVFGGVGPKTALKIVRNGTFEKTIKEKLPGFDPQPIIDFFCTHRLLQIISLPGVRQIPVVFTNFWWSGMISQGRGLMRRLKNSRQDRVRRRWTNGFERTCMKRMFQALFDENELVISM